MKNLYKQIKAKFKKYEKYLLPAMLLLGVVIDFVTFRTLKVETAFSILAVYLVLAALLIIFSNYYQANKLPQGNRGIMWLHAFAPFALQFFFGALLSASFIFYWFSGAFSVSWPFILLLAILMVLNERIREYYLRPSVQIGIFYFVFFSINSVMLPYVLRSISFWVFILAGVMSLVVMIGALKLLAKRVDHLQMRFRQLRGVVLGIFLAMNVFYFTNLIPPVPLAIRDAGVYHLVVRRGSGYEVTTEKETFLEKILPGKTIHKKNGRSIFVFSSIYAPAELNTRIVHHWQYYDESQKKWVSRTKASYRMSGGRQDGYRGFSLSTANTEGKWRVDIETDRGQVIGRVNFNVELVAEDPETEIMLK